MNQKAQRLDEQHEYVFQVHKGQKVKTFNRKNCTEKQKHKP